MEALEMLSVSIIPIGICVILPVLVIWLYMRNKTNETNRRAEVLKLAIEKDTQVDMSGLINSLNNGEKNKGLKERLLTRLMWGCISAAAGLGILGASIWKDIQWPKYIGTHPDEYMVGAIALCVGIGIIISFFIGKKMLKKELEAEAETKADENKKD